MGERLSRIKRQRVDDYSFNLDNDLLNQKSNQKQNFVILLFAVLLNLVAFIALIAIYPPNWYTNDDYRMMTIVSGAYTGTPSADIVFMRYPIGVLLSGLYTLTGNIPWYGVFTMLCMFVPCCIFCYYLIKKAYQKNRTVLGVFIYLLAFVFLIRKYISLPQFTLTSAFLAVGAIVLLMEMPAKRNVLQIILASLCAAFSFSVRSKAFYLVLPLIALVIISRIVNERGTKILRSMIAFCLATVVLCSGVFAVDYIMWHRSEDYQDYKAFNIARSSVYDYGSIPTYYDNMPFYVSNGISEVSYRAVSTRYLDLDEDVDTQMLQKIGEQIEKVRVESGSVPKRLMDAVKDTFAFCFDSADVTVKYGVLFVFILLFTYVALSVKKKKLNIIFPAAVAGFLLECIAMMFAGRLVIRIVDMLFLVSGVVGCLTLFDVIDVRVKSEKRKREKSFNNTVKAISLSLLCVCVLAVVFAGVQSANNEFKKKYDSVVISCNKKLDTLTQYTKTQPDAFFFYDSNDFIASTGYVFETYEKGEILNNGSLGSWNACSPNYYKRNSLYGFTSSADGLTSDDCEVYFVATNNVRMAMTKTLKDKYNKKLIMVDTVDAENCMLHIYMVVDDD